MFLGSFFPGGFYEKQFFPEFGGGAGGRAKAVGGMVLARMLSQVNRQWELIQARRVQEQVEARLLMNQLAWDAEVNFQKAMARSAANTVVLLDL